MSQIKPDWDVYHSASQGKIKNTLFPLDNYIQLSQGDKVLDIGIGNGEKTFSLLKNEYQLTGIEPSTKAIELCQENISKLQINPNQVEIICADFFDFALDFRDYDVIIISHVLQFFTPKELANIFKQINSQAKEGTLIYLQVFSEKEYEKYKVKGILKENISMHFFTKEELLQNFTTWKTLSYIDMELLDLSHGDPHYHHTITYTAIKR